MRGRIVLFVVLAVVAALVGVYVGWSTNTPKAVGEPATATPADSSVGSTQRRGFGSGPARSPTASSQPKATPPKATPPASPPRPSTDPVRFGKVTTTPSDNTTTLDVAESDRRALTAVFSDREVQVGGNETGDRSRSFSMTLPLTDGAKGETLRVYVQGYAVVQGGARAQLTLKVNGQGTVRYYPRGFDDEVFETLEVPATPATTYRLEGVVEVHQVPGANGDAYLNVLSIDASIS
jgi:hypothetical protein